MTSETRLIDMENFDMQKLYDKAFAEGYAKFWPEGYTVKQTEQCAKAWADGSVEGFATRFIKNFPEYRVKIARGLLKINLSLEQIVIATGLTHEEVEKLCEET